MLSFLLTHANPELTLKSTCTWGCHACGNVAELHTAEQTWKVKEESILS